MEDGKHWHKRFPKMTSAYVVHLSANDEKVSSITVSRDSFGGNYWLAMVLQPQCLRLVAQLRKVTGGFYSTERP